MGLHTWSFRGANGQSDGWLTLEGAMAGAPAANDRDGYDLFSFMVARKPILEAIDVEMFEQRYPVLVETRGPRSGAVGAGRYRAGAGCRMRYRPHHADRWQGVMLGMRAHIALPGFAGGLPGGNTTFTRIAADGARETLNNHDGSVIISQGERFEFEIGTGGGFGDPFDRDPALVLTDVRMERIEIREALETYGVAITDDAVDVAATAAIRSTGRSARLAGAAPARAPMDQSLEFQGPDVPLYAGVVQRGNLAIAEESGAILARAPDVWMDGCPVFAYPLGQYAEVRLYLDPRSGRILLADIIPNGVDRSVGMAPDRWVAAA
jgi:N-methylhydantoinase B